jgi:FkbM family methyltransferase
VNTSISGTDASAAPTFALCPNGRRIYVDPCDLRGQRLVASGGDFNPLARTIWRTLLQERSWTHIIDVGANYGEMLIGVTLPQAASVIALEPNPFVLPYLRRSLDEAGVAVELIAKAASSQSGNAILNADHDWSGMSSIAGIQPESAGHSVEAVEVSTLTLASILKECGRPESIRLLVKIDVESHEVSVLQGLLEMVDQLAEFAVMAEIFNLGVPDLEWLVCHFDIELFDKQTSRLVRPAAIAGADLLNLRDADQFYWMDAVLRRQSRHPA